jgi:hypothetical protein
MGKPLSLLRNCSLWRDRTARTAEKVKQQHRPAFMEISSSDIFAMGDYNNSGLTTGVRDPQGTIGFRVEH